MFVSEVLTSTVGLRDETKGKMVQKAKASLFLLYHLSFDFLVYISLCLCVTQIEIVLAKSAKFDSLVPHVTNGKTPEEVAKAESEAAVEVQEAAATEA